MRHTVLIVEDNKATSAALRSILEIRYNVLEAQSLKDAVRAIIGDIRGVDLVLLDLTLPDSKGSDTVTGFVRQFPGIPVVIVTQENDPHVAAEVIKRGACDYVLKNGIYDNEASLLEKITLILKEREHGPDRGTGDGDFFIPSTPRYLDAYRKAGVALRESLSLLVKGETGTGKSNMIRHLHARFMKHKPFVTIDCGVLTESLLDSELFGYRKGAFNEAKEDRRGLIETADDGILFLDEITNASAEMQKKLLRVVQENKVRRVGDNVERDVRFTLVTATNRDIKHDVSFGNFRKDLLFRISEVEVTLPSLREEPEMIGQFARHFISVYNKRCDSDLTLGPEMSRDLLARRWDGNIRELERAVKVCVYSSRYGISLDETGSTGDDIGETFKDKTDKQEKETIFAALTARGWNVTETARFLNINRNTLHSKMKKYGISIRTS